MDIGLYIAEILQDRGIVSVPGVGTFYQKKINSYLDRELKAFLPPVESIIFRLFEENSSIFPEYISEAENIPAEDVAENIKKFATKFNNELATTDTATIQGFGKLKREGSEYIIETFSSYGLKPITESELVLQPSVPDNSPDPEEIGESIFSEEPISEDPGRFKRTRLPDGEEFKNDDIFKNILEEKPPSGEELIEEEVIRRPLWKTLLLIMIPLFLLLVGASLYFFYPKLIELKNTYMQSEETTGFETVVPKPIDSIIDTLKQPADTIKQMVIPPVIKPDSTVRGSKNFEIIIVVFNKKEDAEAYIKQLTNKGIKVHLVEGRTVYKVSAGSFADRTSADKELPLVRKNIKSDAWIDNPK